MRIVKIDGGLSAALGREWMPQAHLSTLRTAHEMTHREHWLHFPTWIVPLLYAVAAIVAGLTFPRIEYYFCCQDSSPE